mmetsp:Transcript_20030/g.41869  ORF Transcript_20030/g.41869 Transcript_20030/m.41869 type:complete len:253 (-) Transcript_20030:146-904(-)
MEESKVQALHDTLSKLKKSAGLGVASHYNFSGKIKTTTVDGKAIREDGLPNNPLYFPFVREGTYDPSKSNAKKYGDGRVIKRNFDDCKPVTPTSDGTSSSDGSDSEDEETKKKRKLEKKERKKAEKKAAKLEAKRQAKIEEKKRAKLEAKKLAKRNSISLNEESEEHKSSNDGIKINSEKGESTVDLKQKKFEPSKDKDEKKKSKKKKHKKAEKKRKHEKDLDDENAGGTSTMAEEPTSPPPKKRRRKEKSS